MALSWRNSRTAAASGWVVTVADPAGQLEGLAAEGDAATRGAVSGGEYSRAFSTVYYRA